MDSVVTFTPKSCGPMTRLFFGESSDSCSPGTLSNLKFIVIAARNMYRESIATTSPKHTRGPNNKSNRIQNNSHHRSTVYKPTPNTVFNILSERNLSISPFSLMNRSGRKFSGSFQNVLSL